MSTQTRLLSNSDMSMWNRISYAVKWTKLTTMGYPNTWILNIIHKEGNISKCPLTHRKDSNKKVSKFSKFSVIISKQVFLDNKYVSKICPQQYQNAHISHSIQSTTRRRLSRGSTCPHSTQRSSRHRAVDDIVIGGMSLFQRSLSDECGI